MDKTLNMALVGASGVVGKKILQLLEKKGIQVDKLFPLGSSTVGQTVHFQNQDYVIGSCLLYTSPSPRDRQKSRMPSSA